MPLFQPLPTGPYDVVYADPPWPYRQSGRGAAINHYDTLSIDQIASLPVRDIVSPSALLFLWGTWPLLMDVNKEPMPVQFKVMRAWGFEPKTIGFVWIKETKTGKLAWGGGAYTRSNSEFCIIGVRGEPLIHRTSRAVHQVVVAPSPAHSAKPPEVRERIVEFARDARRIELFARERVDGWDAWGNEI